MNNENIQKVTDILLTSSGKTVAEAKEYNRKRDPESRALNTTPRVCLDNVKTILEHDERFKDRLCYNVIDMRIYKLDPFPWDDKSKMIKMPGIYGQLGMYLYDDKKDTNEIKRLIQRDYYQNLGEIDMEIRDVAMNNSHHPVREILELMEWDGQKHIRYLMPKYLGVVEDDYQEQALKLIMLTLITRCYAPGSKMDCCLSLGGDQGIGKSTFCKHLAFNDLSLFTDRLGDLSNKDTLQLVAGKMVVELAEMLALKKTKEIEAVKSFLSAQQDTYRAPYDRTWEDHLRQCVLLATTNQQEFLGDLTGDRRWITVECSLSARQEDISDDPEAVEAEFLKAWAEAYHIYKTEHPDLVQLSKMIAPEAKKHAELHTEQNPRIGMIGEYLERCKMNGKYRVCCVEIQQEVFREFDTNRWATKDIATIITTNFPEWVRSGSKQRCGEYGIQVAYEYTPSENEKVNNEIEYDNEPGFREELNTNYQSDIEELNKYGQF